MALLEVKDLKTYFYTRRGTVRAVDGVSFCLDQGEVLGIVGESGSGKSITCRSLLGLVPEPGKIIGGEVKFNGVDLLKISPKKLVRFRGRHMSMILQNPMTALNPVLSIKDQVGEGIKVHFGTNGAELRELVVKLLQSVRIPSPAVLARNFPHQLSGGMRQRVVGAIAISCQPELIIADEPTTSLDVTIQAQYLQLLRQLQQELHVAIIFVTHDFGIIAEVCQRVAVMYAGRIVETATVEELFDSPLHPYTMALLNCVPAADRKISRLCAIPGEPPTLYNIPSGCAFAPRCPQVFDRCKDECPPETWIGDGRMARCWRLK